MNRSLGILPLTDFPFFPFINPINKQPFPILQFLLHATPLKKQRKEIINQHTVCTIDVESVVCTMP